MAIFCLRVTAKSVTLAAPLRRRPGGGAEWLERLLLEGPRTLRLRDEPRAGPRAARDPRAGRCVSGISHGTELSLYRGTSAFADRVFDRDLRAFVRPDPPRPPYPATLGYELVGTVEEAGTDVARARGPATSSTSARRTARRRCSTSTPPPPPPTRPCGCPHGEPLERWLFVSVGAVALVAAHDARIKLGDHVAVIGLGAIGLLLVQMARLAGAGARHAPSTRSRRGASSRSRSAPTRRSTRATAPDGAGAAIKRAAARGVDVAVETSGATAGLHDAVAAPGLGGTRRHRRLLPGRRARAAARRGVAPQPARHGLEHGRLGRAAPRVPGVGPPARACARWWTCWPRAPCASDALPVRRFPFEQAVEAYGWLDENPERGGQGGVHLRRLQPRRRAVMNATCSR